MRTFAKALIGITLVVMLFGGYVLFGPKAQIIGASQELQSASARADAFASIMEGVQRQDFGGNQYKRPNDIDISGYQFINFTLMVRNMNILPVEWAQINISPVSGDIVLISGEPVDIGPFRTAAVTASLLVENVSAEADHMIWVDYYLFGSKQSVVP